MALRRKICIVTPDVVGPINNGGIGTHAHNLAVELQGNGAEVTVLFTGPCEIGTVSQWRTWYKKKGITFISVDDLPKIPYPLNNQWYVERSYRVFSFLRTCSFDVLHFQEWQANGFHCIQAKKTTDDFANTLITVTMHSSTEWINEGQRHWLDWAVPEAKLQWCERYCCENADIVISPSQHMFDWAVSHSWTLAEDRRVIPCCFQAEKDSSRYSPDLSQIAFFGRLETRKGLEIFLDALALLSEEQRAEIKCIHFLGKNGVVSTGEGNAAIQDRMDELSMTYKIMNDLDVFQAHEYLCTNKCAVFVPSLLDNCPYTVLECTTLGIPVMGGRSGGIGEIISDACLFEPTARGIAAALSQVLAGEVDFFSAHKYDAVKANRMWVEVSAESPKDSKAYELAKARVQAEQPLVSICVPYYNYGDYVGELLSSIQRSDYQNYEVIIVDDGSPAKHSREVFDEYMKNPPEKMTFLRKENSGVGATRNFAASKANGDYLIFMDSDNAATPSMITDFLVGIYKSGVDVLTCHFKAFDSGSVPIEGLAPIYAYIPIGPALEVGMIENVFGDANFIVKAEVFRSVGGFKTERHTSWEDWDLLARMSLAGFKQDVITKQLFWYRHTPEGFSRNTNLYQNHRRVLQAYADHLPTYGHWVLNSVLVPYHYRFGNLHEHLCTVLAQGAGDGMISTSQGGVLSPGALRIAYKIQKIANALLPRNSWRRSLVKKMFLN